MYPTLYHFFKDIFSIEWDFLKNIYSYGLIVSIAVLIGFWLFKKQLKRTFPINNQYKFIALNVLFLSLFFGLIGGKLFAWIEHPRTSYLWDSPFSELSIYGCLLFGLLANYIYFRVKQLSTLKILDAAAPSLMLSYGIGRLACHISGDGDWGIINTSSAPSFIPKWLWSYNYPHNILQEGHYIPNCQFDDYCYALSEPVYPTPLYELIIAFLFFLILIRIRKNSNISGTLFFIYLMLNGIERFFIEFIRVNDKYDWFFKLSQAQIIALFLFFTGGILFYRLRRNSHL